MRSPQLRRFRAGVVCGIAIGALSTAGARAQDDFPGGTCAVACTKHEDCPDGSRCIEKEGGFCLLSCTLPGDCRGGYTCKGVKNEFGGGESLVCTK